jgi:hypothetical protein
MLEAYYEHSRAEQEVDYPPTPNLASPGFGAMAKQGSSDVALIQHSTQRDGATHIEGNYYYSNRRLNVQMSTRVEIDKLELLECSGEISPDQELELRSLSNKHSAD